MCGEHPLLPILTYPVRGSSPHVRGARLLSRQPRHGGGIIPACAGSTRKDSRRRSLERDHPRMCGEHNDATPMDMRDGGSSPHVRGAPSLSMRTVAPTGIIPACAGSTSCTSISGTYPWDHPRMCGEHEAVDGGDHLVEGSSPHVRGALLAVLFDLRVVGIIPACAGSTMSPTSWLLARWDHPRMCGEHAFQRSGGRYESGSSPHVRGARSSDSAQPLRVGIIPACAGSTTAYPDTRSRSWDHPRMCGEHTFHRP